MNHSRSCFALLAAGALLTVPAFAQSGNSPERPEPTPASASLTNAANSTGRAGGAGVVKEFRFAAVDTDSDGFISRAEFVAFVDSTAPRSSGGTASDMPTSGSSGASSDRPGMSSASAGTATAESSVERFRLIDQDNNGFLSQAEVNAYQNNQDNKR